MSGAKVSPRFVTGAQQAPTEGSVKGGGSFVGRLVGMNLDSQSVSESDSLIRRFDGFPHHLLFFPHSVIRETRKPRCRFRLQPCPSSSW